MNIEKSVKVSAAMAGTTQKELAAHIGITSIYLGKVMKDNSPRHVEAMANFYGVPVSEFVKRGEQ